MADPSHRALEKSNQVPGNPDNDPMNRDDASSDQDEASADRAVNRDKVVLIDAFSLLYRAFYALPDLRAADGTPTQAVYGFALMLLRLLEEEQPGWVAVVTDRSGPTFRSEIFSDYKAHRPEMPDDLRAQVPVFYRLLEALNIPIVGVDGYEADDCMGALAHQARERGLKTVIVSGDRDLLQLVDDSTEVVLTRRGIRETERLDTRGVKETMGVFPHQVPDLKGLVGDASDNIPGVPGVGPKTAARWLEKYDTLENLIEHADEIKGKAGETFRSLLDQVRMSKKLATIETDVPLSLDWTSIERKDPRWEELFPLLEQLGFESLLRRMREMVPADQRGGGNGSPEASEAQAQAEPGRLVDEDEAARALLEELEPVDSVTVAALVTGDHPLEMNLVGVGLSWEGGGAIVPLQKDHTSLSDDRIRDVLAAVCGDPERRTVVFDAKSLMHALRPLGVDLAEPYDDLSVAAYLLRPGERAVEAAQMIETFLGEDVAAPTADGNDLLQPAWLEDKGAALSAYADALRRCQPVIREHMRHDGLLELYETIELPLTKVLAHMEAVGIRVDAAYLDDMGKTMAERLERMTAEIYRMAGETFNVNSPRQLGTILYDKLELPVLKRTKTGPSTDADVLEQLADKHPLPEAVLTYRQLAKLKNTYVDTLPRLIHPESGRVHTSFNQTVTATGRLSSTHPNLQNIPVRTEEGRLIRAAFTAGGEDRVLMTADYSQIELRVLAHLSQDETLIAAFREGEDIHARTASEVFGVPIDQVTGSQRDAAKAINFGIIYGISSFGLAKGTGLTRNEAQRYIDGYFERYPRVKAYLDEMKEKAHRDGFVTTLCGRRRYLPEIKSRQWARRQFAERTAMNTPIQGSAADIIKISMVKLHRRLEEWGDEARLLLQVHDELVLECPRARATELGRAVKEEMEQAVRLEVPLVAEVRVGTDWRDTEPLNLDE